MAELEAEVHNLRQQLHPQSPALHKRRRLAVDSAGSSPDCSGDCSGGGAEPWHLTDDAADNEAGSASDVESPAAEQHRCSPTARHESHSNGRARAPLVAVCSASSLQPSADDAGRCFL